MTNFGHVAYRVYGKGYDLTFDFGRYHGGHGYLSSEGEGILRVWTNRDAFVKSQTGEGDLLSFSYVTNKEFDSAALGYYKKQIDAGKELVDKRDSHRVRTAHRKFKLTNG